MHTFRKLSKPSTKNSKNSTVSEIPENKTKEKQSIRSVQGKKRMTYFFLKDYKI